MEILSAPVGRDSNAVRIGVDIDGVLSDTHSELVNRISALGYAYKDHTKWLLTDQFEGLPKEVGRQMLDDPEMYASTLPFAKSAATLRFLEEIGYQLWLVTARPRTAEIVTATTGWLRTHGFPNTFILFNENKSDAAVQFDLKYFVEDNAKNAVGLTNVCDLVFLVNRPHNLVLPRFDNPYVSGKLIRVNSIAEVPCKGGLL